LVGEAAVATWTKHDAKGLAQATDGLGQSRAHAHQLGPGRQHGAQAVAFQTLDLDRAIPAGAHELSQAEAIVLVRLVRLQGQRGRGLTSMQADHRYPRRSKTVPEPDRQRSGLHANTLGRRRSIMESQSDGLGCRGAATPSQLAALCVDDTDRRLLLRDIQPYILAHEASPALG
jgi:hypothetical protein